MKALDGTTKDLTRIVVNPARCLLQALLTQDVVCPALLRKEHSSENPHRGHSHGLAVWQPQGEIRLEERLEMQLVVRQPRDRPPRARQLIEQWRVARSPLAAQALDLSAQSTV